MAIEDHEQRRMPIRLVWGDGKMDLHFGGHVQPLDKVYFNFALPSGAGMYVGISAGSPSHGEAILNMPVRELGTWASILVQEAEHGKRVDAPAEERTDGAVPPVLPQPDAGEGRDTSGGD